MTGTNITAQTIINATAGQFITQIAGTEIIAGLLLLAVVGYLLHKSNAGLDSFMIILFPIVLVLSAKGYLPDWMVILCILASGILFARGFLKLMMG